MSNELVNKQQSSLPAVPDYLKVQDDHSLDTVKQYVRPSRIKVVQSTAESKLKDSYGVGSVILLPEGITIVTPARDERGNINYGTTPPFTFTPIFFFAEFCVWNPLSTKGKLPAIRERSFDQNSQIAIRARSMKDRKRPCPEEPTEMLTYCEHLNFVVHLHGYPDQVILSFSRGEFNAGQNFAGLLRMRQGVPMYGNNFEAHLNYRENAKGNWIGLDISNPTEVSPFVDEEAFRKYQLLYQDYAKLYADRMIEIHYEDEDVIDVTVSEAANSI